MTPTQIGLSVYAATESTSWPVDLTRIYDIFPSDLKRTKTSVVVIGADSEYEYPVANRFEEAQVIGRCFLSCFDRPELTEKELADVEEFAISLLVPEDDFRVRAMVTSQGDEMDVAGLAQVYDVPKPVIVKQAQRLDLI